MKFEELKNSLKEKIYSAYLLHGVDEFLLSSAYN
jgi:DNA polymerase III delta subunit